MPSSSSRDKLTNAAKCASSSKGLLLNVYHLELSMLAGYQRHTGSYPSMHSPPRRCRPRLTQPLMPASHLPCALAFGFTFPRAVLEVEIVYLQARRSGCCSTEVVHLQLFLALIAALPALTLDLLTMSLLSLHNEHTPLRPPPDGRRSSSERAPLS